MIRALQATHLHLGLQEHPKRREEQSLNDLPTGARITDDTHWWPRVPRRTNRSIIATVSLLSWEARYTNGPWGTRITTGPPQTIITRGARWTRWALAKKTTLLLHTL